MPLPEFSIADILTDEDRARALPLPEEARLAILPYVNRQIKHTPLYTRQDLMTPEDRVLALPLTNEIRGAILPQQGGTALSNDFTASDIMADEDKRHALPIMSEVHKAILPRIVPVAAVRAVEEPAPEPTQEEVLVSWCYRGIAGDSNEDGLGDAVLHEPFYSPGCMSQEFYDTYWDGHLKQNRPIRNYRVADFPSGIISARLNFRCALVYSYDGDPFERWGPCYLAHYNKPAEIGGQQDYEASCADFYHIRQAGVFEVDLTDPVKNAQTNGKRFFTIKFYFKTNELTEGDGCGLSFDVANLFVTYKK